MNKVLSIARPLWLACATTVAGAAVLGSGAPAAPDGVAAVQAADKPAHVSPYALAARRHALAASYTPLKVIPPSQRHTRVSSAQVQSH